MCLMQLKKRSVYLLSNISLQLEEKCICQGGTNCKSALLALADKYRQVEGERNASKVIHIEAIITPMFSYIF